MLTNSQRNANASHDNKTVYGQRYAVFYLNASGFVAQWNNAAQSLFGYEQKEAKGLPLSALYAEDEPGKSVADLQAAKTGFHESGGHRVRKDGSLFSVHSTISSFFDANEELTGYVVVTLDTLSTHRFERRFRQVVESAPNAMVMINSDGTMEMVNSQAEQLFGYDRTEMLGKPVELLLPDNLKEHHPGLRNNFFFSPLSRPMGKGRDLYAKHKNGKDIPVEIGLNPIETDEGIKVLSAVVDISDRKQKEDKIQAALEEKDVLLGEIHHRVKNNLQIVYSLLDLQSFSIEDEKVLSMLRDSQHRIQSMALIHQTLYQSRDFASVDFHQVLHSLIPTLMQTYAIDSCHIDYKIESEDVYIPLNQAIPCGLILNELVTNALKHAYVDRTQGEVIIRLEKQDQQVHLSIEDNGQGIPNGFDADKSESLGIRLVSILTKQIGGELTVQKSDPTKIKLSFTLEVKE